MRVDRPDARSDAPYGFFTCLTPAGMTARSDSSEDETLTEAFDEHRDRLRRMVQMRLDWRLQPRVDASDVIQEAYVEAFSRFETYQREQPMPLFLWLRFLVAERLTTLHRHHLGVKKRTANREVPLHRRAMPEASSIALVARLMDAKTTPSQAALRSERAERLQAMLNDMDEIDREVLTLRHFEHLTRSESAAVLGITEAAAGKRYLRALRRLKDVMNEESEEADGHRFSE